MKVQISLAVWIIVILYLLVLVSFSVWPSFFSRAVLGLESLTIAVLCSAFFILAPVVVAFFQLQKTAEKGK